MVNEEIVAMADLAWPEMHIVIISPSLTEIDEFTSRFNKAGFLVFTPVQALEQSIEFVARFTTSSEPQS